MTEKYFYRSPGDQEGQPHTLVLPSEEHLVPLAEGGIFDALDRQVEALKQTQPNVVVVQPYYKNSGDTIALGVLWDFTDEKKDTRSCNAVIVEYDLPQGGETGTVHFTARGYHARLPIERVGASLAHSEIKQAVEHPVRKVWTEPIE